jgi:hypothetical protein
VLVSDVARAIHIIVDRTDGPSWWQTPLLAGAFALVGVLIAQGIVLWLARRTERNRSEPELLRQCAAFSVATGKLKREFAQRPDGPNLGAIADLEAASDALDIIGTPEIEDAARDVVGAIPLLMHPGRYAHEDREASLDRLFRAHTVFVAACRAHFDKPPHEHMAMPMLGPVD